MATIFIVGEAGTKDLWLVDTGAGTVEPLDATGDGGLDDDVQRTIGALRENGFCVVKNVDVAIAATSGDDVTGRVLTSRVLTSRVLTGS